MLYKALDRTAERYWREVEVYSHMMPVYMDAFAVVDGFFIAVDFYGNYATSPPRVVERNVERMKVAELSRRNIPFLRLKRNMNAIEIQVELYTFTRTLKTKGVMRRFGTRS